MADDVLRLTGVSKSFGAVPAAQVVNLTIRSAEIHALIGPNGAGKSTLIGLITGAVQPDGGSIHLGGTDISSYSVAARARAGLGRSFQVSALALPLSAKRNVMMAVQGASGSSFRFWRSVETDDDLTAPALRALSRVGLKDRADVTVAELSHGERRLVELACALAQSPAVLLLDEPMAGLGPEGTAAMTTLLDTLRQEVPILLIEHDMDAVFHLADRISVLVSGAVIAHGTADEIRKDPAVQTAYLGEGDHA